LATTAYLETHLSGSAVSDPRHVVRLRYHRFVPEYCHPADAHDSRAHVPPIFPGSNPVLHQLTFPYADRLKSVVVEGELEVLDRISKPLDLPNARWEGSVKTGVRLTSDLVTVGQGVHAQLNDSYPPYTKAERPIVRGRLFVEDAHPAADWQVGAVVVDPKVGDWQERLSKAMNRGGGIQVSLGTVRGSLVIFNRVRQVPFRLVVPMGERDPNDLVRSPSTKRAFPAVMAWPRLSRAAPAKPN
jgi:hypothetical protein